MSIAALFSRKSGLTLLRWLFVLVSLFSAIVILQVFPHTYAEGRFDIPRVVAWVICLGGILSLFVQAGLEIKGRVLGVLIDERNRFSLSRLQMTLWTILVLATLYVVFVTNIVRGATVTDALNVNLDWNLIVLMGISVTSYISSPIALSRKTNNIADAAQVASASDQLTNQQNLAARPDANGTVLIKQDPQDARMADFIRGEDVGNATLVDISRTQMLIITVIVVVAYGFAICNELALGPGTLAKLPDLHQTLLGLILVSHASYIGGKLTPTTVGTAGANSAAYLARALQLNQRAADLVRDLRTRLAAAQPGVGAKAINDTLTLALGAAAQTATMPVRVTAVDFKVDELSVLEGRVDALMASVGSLVGTPRLDDIGNAPATQKVAEVQRKLRARGCQDVVESGIPDAATDLAIRTVLSALGVDRRNLHPRPYRFYEELASLL